MAFNLANYEPVEDRLRRFWADSPEGRIITRIHPSPEGEWIIETQVWRDGSRTLPDATGYAHEVVTSRGVNATSALENCETSSIGRALANLGYAPKGARPSREEMQKVERPAEPLPDALPEQIEGWEQEILDADSQATLRTIGAQIAQHSMTEDDRARLRAHFVVRRETLTSGGTA